ncbi:1468_t:CDS:2 [Paraglomus occultum]|uniref:1468_t:CDS:1 n=1 Tax=Paraglomus occultum TaxID=144539 RepID=A0A9N8VY13_9GLOM|nr:1468_t:CDS:2 [Paraglomus occultum]
MESAKRIVRIIMRILQEQIHGLKDSSDIIADNEHRCRARYQRDCCHINNDISQKYPLNSASHLHIFMPNSEAQLKRAMSSIKKTCNAFKLKGDLALANGVIVYRLTDDGWKSRSLNVWHEKDPVLP